MTAVVTAGGVSVTIRGAVVDESETVLSRLVSDGVPRSLTSGQPTLWGPDAAAEASRRLGWLRLPERSRPLPSRLAELAGAARDAGLDRVVLAGVGGAALAPEVIARASGVPLTALDTTDPLQVGRALDGDLHRTLVVVADPSGGNVEADALRRVFEAAFAAAGITGADLARRFVVVTDPGSPLAEAAGAAGYRLLPSPGDVGGRFAALSALGLAPPALAGADVAGLLEDAAALVPALAQPYDNPALALGAVLGAAGLVGRDKLLIADNGSGLAGLDGWIEHMVAESTGKDGRGLLPVVVEDVDAPGFQPADDVRRVVLGTRPDDPRARGPFGEETALSVSGPLGAQFLLWQYATAVACRVLGVNPFDQPDVQASERNTAALLRAEEGAAPTVISRVPALVCDEVEVHAPEELVRGVTDLAGVLETLLETVPDGGYLAVMAYLDREGDAAAADLRRLLAARGDAIRKSPAPVTFGWGPRLLHTTGQYHKGGPQNGVFLQITGEASRDVPVPGRPYSLRELQLAQAFGDLRALRSVGRPAVRLHLRDRAEGIARLCAALTD
ncbi:glucose-6-phosphate isomerase [Actinomadura rubrobrunea]|uniref:Glucose-6-phosphate isomerase n=1 Tax=Actinomadura rubrobrunea TaxID=115335 RepID=A0A9W6PY09_9ACTN|nr:glucose-6-phosphate isomerase [Actinomadura rubrobrunea]GLW65046.1 glucose-6-phosphate isomerase [Actinomadura rubrobrunea]